MAEYSIRQKEGHFELYIDNVYHRSYETVLEAADAVEKLMKEEAEEENQNGSKI